MPRRNRIRITWSWKQAVFGFILLAVAISALIAKTQAGNIVAFISLVAALGQWLLPIAPTQKLQMPQSSNQFTQSFFIVGGPLQDPKEFWGRENTRNFLVDHTRNGASTSIIGTRGIGKTWLIQYLRLMADKEFSRTVHISCIDPQLPSCATLSKSITQVLSDFGAPIQGNESMDEKLIILEKTIKDMKSRNQMFILCIEIFEHLCKLQDFSLRVLETLRAITTQHGLILITSSREPLRKILIDVLGKSADGSPFYIGLQQVTLEPFDEQEAKIFVHNKGFSAGFTRKEQDLYLKYARIGNQQWLPLRLQLVGQMLLAEKSRANYQSDEDYLDSRGFRESLEENYRSMRG